MQLYFDKPEKWRKWLFENHAKEKVVWLLYYHKDSGKKSMDYEASVEEALCFGWIDSIIKNIDDNSYLRKFNPRQITSKWSEINKKRAAKLIKSGRMTEFGIAKINAAKKNGMWNNSERPEFKREIPVELEDALKKNTIAKKNYYNLAPTYQKHYNLWISTAKRPETREKRIKEAVELLFKNEKLGLR